MKRSAWMLVLGIGLLAACGGGGDGGTDDPVCPCPPADHGTSACSGGVCGITSCERGFADCDGLVPDGCETDLSISAEHCGTCDHPCPLVDHGTPACRATQCAIGACDPGYSDCDGFVETGCETATTSDSHNCGGCGQFCLGGQHCVNSECVADATSCSGCVSNNLCLRGDSADACGSGGATCVPCPLGKTCGGSPNACR